MTSRSPTRRSSKQFEDQKQQSFPNEKDYQQFLETSGQTEEDLLFRVELDVLSNKVREEIIEGTDEISDEDIENYYEENKERFAQPERRDLERRPDQERGTRERGQARRSSQARASSHRREGLLDRRGLQGAGREAARRRPGPAGEGVRRRDLRGRARRADRPDQDPVRLVRLRGHQGHGRVAAVARGRARRRSSSLLRSEREQKALDDFIEDFQEKYKDETQCADDYVVDDCDNASDEHRDRSGLGWLAAGRAAAGRRAPARASARSRSAADRSAASDGSAAAGAAGPRPAGLAPRTSMSAF